MATARVELREPSIPMDEYDVGDGTFDVSTVTGDERLMLLILRGMFTRPGDVQHRPEYGAALQDFRSRPYTQHNVLLIRNRVRQFMASLPDVADHAINPRASGTTGGWVFDLRVRTVDGRIAEAHDVSIEVPA